MKTTQYSIYTHLVCALYYGELDGLEDSDIEEIDHIKETLTTQLGVGWSVVGVSDDSSFSRPEIALSRNVWGDCSEITVSYN